MAEKAKIEVLEKAREVLTAQVLRSAENVAGNLNNADLTGEIEKITRYQNAVDALDRAIANEQSLAGSGTGAVSTSGDPLEEVAYKSLASSTWGEAASVVEGGAATEIT